MRIYVSGNLYESSKSMEKKKSESRKKLGLWKIAVSQLQNCHSSTAPEMCFSR